MYEVNGNLYHLQTPLNNAFHRMESAGFYFNMVLFALHGLCSGSWGDEDEDFAPPWTLTFQRVAGGSTLVAWTCMGVFLPALCVLRMLFSHHADAFDEKKWIADDKAGNYLVWVFLHYWCGYACIFLQSAYILAWRRRTLLVLRPIAREQL
jgi:hypothetical protein